VILWDECPLCKGKGTFKWDRKGNGKPVTEDCRKCNGLGFFIKREPVDAMEEECSRG
jgi:DnaJ-class molecular chaperone